VSDAAIKELGVEDTLLRSLRSPNNSIFNRGSNNMKSPLRFVQPSKQ
ncbi:13132_t:CDS:1, partial [Funneliformis caledonium]